MIEIYILNFHLVQNTLIMTYTKSRFPIYGFCDKLLLTDIKKKHFSLFPVGGYFGESWLLHDDRLTGKTKSASRGSLGILLQNDRIFAKTDVFAQNCSNFKKTDFSEFLRYYKTFLIRRKLKIHIFQITSFLPPSLVFTPFLVLSTSIPRKVECW